MSRQKTIWKSSNNWENHIINTFNLWLYLLIYQWSKYVGAILLSDESIYNLIRICKWYMDLKNRNIIYKLRYVFQFWSKIDIVVGERERVFYESVKLTIIISWHNIYVLGLLFMVSIYVVHAATFCVTFTKFMYVGIRQIRNIRAEVPNKIYCMVIYKNNCAYVF